jgi:predicted DNA-binding WGR domain protein
MTNNDRLTCTFSLHFREGNSDKFYVATLDGNVVKIYYGRTGRLGQRAEKPFPTPEAAAKEFYKLARDKMRKGYRVKEASVEADPSVFRRARIDRGGEYGGVTRERSEVSLADGARMIDNLTKREPDQDLLFDSMFVGEDAELVATLARSHPSVGEDDLAGVGAWLSAGSLVGV